LETEKIADDEKRAAAEAQARIKQEAQTTADK